MPYARESSLLNFLRGLLAPFCIFTCGFVAVAITEALCRTEIAQRWALNTGWCIGPWRQCPIPFDSSTYSNTGFFRNEASIDWRTLVATTFLITGLLLTALHGLIFEAALVMFRCFGWPKYMPHITGRLSLMEMWRSSVFRSSWVFPVAIIVAQLWDAIETAQVYAGYQSVNVGTLFEIGLILVAMLACFQISSRQIVRAVQSSLRPEDLRCRKCGYLIRGLSDPQCPECGTGFDLSARPTFTLFRRSYVRRPLVRWVLWSLMATAIVLIPAWEPILSEKAISILPYKHPLRRFFSVTTYQQPYAYPVKKGSFCLLRHDTEAIVLWVPFGNAPPSELQWKYWKEFAVDWSYGPGSTGMIEIATQRLVQDTIGSNSICSYVTTWGGTWWVVIYPPSKNWSVAVITIDEATASLRRLFVGADEIKSK